jgi:hypothetical protein
MGIAHSVLSVNKQSRHRQFLFLIVRFLKQLFILAKQFQRRRFLESDESKTRKQELPVAAMFVNGS